MKNLFRFETKNSQFQSKKICMGITYIFLLLLFSVNVCYGQWLPQTSRIITPNHHILSISVVDENVVWAAVDTSVYVFSPPDSAHFMRTTDGGLNWETKSIAGFKNEYIDYIYAINADTAWICGDRADGTGGIYKTTDGGISWQKQTTIASYYIYFFDEQAGLFITYNGFVYTTDNGGTSWEKVPDSNFPVPLTAEYTIFYSSNNLVAQMGDTVWYGTTKGRIYRTTNRGLNWSVYNALYGQNAGVNSIAFQDSKNGIAVSCLNARTFQIGPNKMVRTRDGGETWSAITAPEKPSAANITYVPGTDSTYFLTSSVETLADHGSAYTKDFGKTWTLIDSFPYNAVAFISPTVGWTGGLTTETHGGMYKWSGDLLVAIENTKKTNSPAEFTLKQNYPNPFNPLTKIEYQLAKRSNIDLSIYNLSGQKITTLVNKSQIAGKYSISFNASRLASGIYFYVLKTDKGYIATKKFILLK